jgi:nuclease S1
VVRIVLVAFLGEILVSNPVWAWFAGGHEIVAIIAADELTPAARSNVAKILGAPADTGSVEEAMAAASLRPDTEFRDEDRTSVQWHFLDICFKTRKQIYPRGAHMGIA